MNWSPTKSQLELLADCGAARMPLEAIAQALGVPHAVLATWG
jgi:hypothetical protein